MNKITNIIVDQRKIGAKAAATTYTSCQSDRHCSVTQVQATAADSDTVFFGFSGARFSDLCVFSDQNCLQPCPARENPCLFSDFGFSD
jgi:hypothetical protein